MKITKERGLITIEKGFEDNCGPYDEIIELRGNGGWLDVQKYRSETMRSDRKPFFREVSHASFDVSEWLQLVNLVNEHLVVTTREGESIFQVHVQDDRDPTLTPGEQLDIYETTVRDEIIGRLKNHPNGAEVLDILQSTGD